MNLKEIEDFKGNWYSDFIAKTNLPHQIETEYIYDSLVWLISEVKKKNLPIKSTHCRTTHTACECILDNMNKLEERVKELEAEIEDMRLEAKEEYPDD